MGEDEEQRARGAREEGREEREEGRRERGCVLSYLGLGDGGAHVGGTTGGVPVGEDGVGIKAVVVNELGKVVQLVLHSLDVHLDVADAV